MGYHEKSVHLSKIAKQNSQTISKIYVESGLHTGPEHFFSFAWNNIVSWSTQLILAYLHFMLPKEDLFGSFCHHSIMSFLLGRASFKLPAQATGSHISPWCSQLELRGQGSFHSDPWSCENYLHILFVTHTFLYPHFNISEFQIYFILVS